MQRQATYFRVMMATLALVGALRAPNAQAQICVQYEIPTGPRDPDWSLSPFVIALNEIELPSELTVSATSPRLSVSGSAWQIATLKNNTESTLGLSRTVSVSNLLGVPDTPDTVYLTESLLSTSINEVKWTFNGLETTTLTNWVTVVSSSVPGSDDALVALSDGALNNWDVVISPRLETDESYPPGVYELRSQVKMRVDSQTAEPTSAFELVIQVTVDASRRIWVTSTGLGAPPTNSYLTLRAVAPNASKLNVIMQYIPPQGGNPLTLPVFMGNEGGGVDLYDRNPDSGEVDVAGNEDIALVFTDSAQASGHALYDRSVPALTGYAKPSLSGASGGDGAVLSGLDDRLETAFSIFNAAGSYLVFIYTDDDSDDFKLIELCYAPFGSLEGDTDPRGSRFGGPATGVINVNDGILSAFFVSAFEFLDTRLMPIRDSALALRAAQVQPDALSMKIQVGDEPTSRTVANTPLEQNVPTNLARGFESGTALESYWNSARQGRMIEFATVDVAPASSRGDGVISLADFVVAFRNAGGVGFPTPDQVGGPLSPGDRQLRLGLNPGDRTILRRGTAEAQIPEIPVVLRTKGVEQTVAIGIQYDPAVLEFVSARRAGRVLDIPTFEINNNTLEGIVGLEVAVRPNRTFPLLENGLPQDPSTTFAGTGEGGAYRTGDGFNRDEVIAYVKFRPIPDAAGTVNTELQFIQEAGPLGGREPSVRSPDQSKLYAAYISGGVTVLDPGDAPSRLRLADTVLKQGVTAPLTLDNLQRVDVVLESNGLEGAAGFTLDFDPSQVTIAGILKGADLPGDAFVLTNPDFTLDEVLIQPNDSEEVKAQKRAAQAARLADFAARTSAAGEFKMLFALQPGESFAEGRRVVATLLVNPLVAPAGETATKIGVTFKKLGDLLEIVDANAIPVSSVFGREANNADSMSVVSGSCSYSIAIGRTNPPNPANLGEFDLNGGTATINITTPGVLSCPWTANLSYGGNSGTGWIVFADGAEPSGTGSRELTFTVATYTGQTNRTATITIGGQTVTITQFGCGITAQFASPNDANFTGLGGNGTILIDARADSCSWTAAAVSEGSWIRFAVPGGSPQTTLSGTGDATLSFIISPNTSEARTGRITINDITLTVRQDFTFSSNSEGWAASSPFSDLFTNASGTYVAPAAGVANATGRLQLSTVNNTNTFGYWESSLFTLTADPDALYRATFRVSTSVAERGAVPSFRLRAATADFSQSAEYKVDSFTAVDATADASPNVGGVIYEHYFNLPRNQSQFRMFFDIINFDPSDAPVASISLNSMAVAKFSRAGLADTRAEGAPIISKDTPFLEIPIAQVYGRTPEQMVAPSFIADARGQLIRSGSVDPITQKASIGILTKFTDKTLSTNRLYEARFTVTSRSALSATVRKEMVPTFRLRVGEGSGQISSLLNIESINADSIVPTLSESEIYSVWLGSNTAIVNNALNFSLDFVYETSGQNDPAIGLIIEKVEVFSYARP